MYKSLTHCYHILGALVVNAQQPYYKIPMSAYVVKT
jgi:hypothetical protein